VFFYAAGSGPVRDALLIGPPFTINGEDIDLMVEALGAALADTLAT
jgi:adenosylmethionine-8-amino-7-oxononanoate aminotransferase